MQNMSYNTKETASEGRDSMEGQQKIHITLVGGQSYPVYLGIVETKPDRAVLLCSKETRGSAEHIAEVAGIPPERREAVILDPVDVSQVSEAIGGWIAGMSPDAEYSVNVTGGTKIWAIVLYSLLSGRQNVRMFYIDQSNRLYDLSDISRKPSVLGTDMDVVFRLNGASAESYRAITEFTDEDWGAVTAIENIYLRNHRPFQALTNPKFFRNRDEIEVPYSPAPANGSTLEFDEYEGKGHADMRFLGNNGKPHPYRLDAPHLRELLFFAGWFELRVAGMLARWKKGSDIRLGVSFRYTSPESRPTTKNEIDIIMNTGVRLLFVECKTQISATTDIDKFKTAVGNFGGTGCMALFVSYYTMLPNTREKCRDCNVMCFSINDAQDEFRARHGLDRTSWMSERMKAEMNEYVDRELARLLDDQLRKSNKK
ncbi:MAG: DUF1887 family CARF protein [Succinivibrionaceae bacterium]|nr:DUF1887 family CARF protein [Succinivibrionaceae bacterium]MDY6375485.1 DUF1887 family CARF protein [Succinivibrionaceae bacterium]